MGNTLSNPELKHLQAAKDPYLNAPSKTYRLVNVQNGQCIPLSQVEYNVEILDSVSSVQVSLIFENPSSANVVDAEFLMSVNKQAAFHSLRVLFEDRTLVGQIKEKQTAKQEYRTGMQKGHTMIYTEVAENNFLRMNLGNLLPLQRVTVILSYLEPLEVCVNKFWRLCLPRLCAQNRIMVQIKSSTRITLIKSPTHNLKEVMEGCNATVETSDPADSDFVLLFSTEEIHRPQLIIGESNFDTKYCAQISFIPEFNKSSIGDAYSAYVEDNAMKHDDFLMGESEFIGDYIFLIDRSGSMAGSRIEKAKEALLLFIMSLPNQAHFNIYSFGGTFKQMFPTCQLYTEQTIEQAKHHTARMKADMGGTNIYNPLKHIIESQTDRPCILLPNNKLEKIFILTDGEVDDTQAIISLLAKEHHKKRKIYTLGIGNTVQRELIESVAEVGAGLFEFIEDKDDLNAKVITLLQDSISPFIDSIEFQADGVELATLLPDPVNYVGLSKNKGVTFFAYLDTVPKGDIHISCKAGPFNFNQIISTNVNTIKTDTFHILAAHKMISFIDRAIKFRQTTVPILMPKPTKLDKEFLVQTSVRFGVLSSHTSFICTATDNMEDIPRQIILQHQEKEEINLENQFIGSRGGRGGSRGGSRGAVHIGDPITDLNIYGSRAMDMRGDYENERCDKREVRQKSRRDYEKERCDKSYGREARQKSRSRSRHQMSPVGSRLKKKKPRNDSSSMERFQPDSNFVKKRRSTKSPIRSTSGYIDIISKQSLDGSFKFDQQVLNDYKIDQVTLQSLFDSQLDVNIISTMLIMAILETKWKAQQQSWQMVFNKAKQYLKNQGYDIKTYLPRLQKILQ